MTEIYLFSSNLRNVRTLYLLLPYALKKTRKKDKATNKIMENSRRLQKIEL